MKKTSDYEQARKRILDDRNNPQARKRRSDIRDRDERNIRRYGECPAKFADFLAERAPEEGTIREESEARYFKVHVVDRRGNLVDYVEIYAEDGENYLNIRADSQPDHTGEVVALPVNN
jgi:hypothetical protein